MHLLHDQRQPCLEGGFNGNHLFTTHDGHTWLRREVHGGGSETLQKIRDEFAGYGWMDHGNTVRKRSICEQVALSLKARMLGLLVLNDAAEDRGTMLMPYVDHAESIDRYLAQAEVSEAHRMIRTLYADLRTAHDNGIVYGDRWSDNILVIDSPRPRAVHIDFDLQYEGPDACAMDIGRMTFYLLHAGRDKVRSTIAKALHQRKGSLDMQMVERIVRGHAEHFAQGRFGGANLDIDALFHELPHHD